MSGGTQEIPDSVPRQQVEERRRLGLPVLTDIERSAFEGNWH